MGTNECLLFHLFCYVSTFVYFLCLTFPKLQWQASKVHPYWEVWIHNSMVSLFLVQKIRNKSGEPPASCSVRKEKLVRLHILVF